MKKLLFLISCLALYSGIHAQTLSAFKTNNIYTPTLTILNGDIINTTTIPSTTNQSKILFKNTSALTQTYTVYRTILFNSPLLDVSCASIIPNTYFCFGFTIFPDCINTPSSSDYTVLGPTGSTVAPYDNNYTNTNPFIIYLDEASTLGQYHVKYKLANVSNANDTLSFTIKYNVTLGLKEADSIAEAFDLYPNPSSNNASINFNLKSESILKIKIYNSLGTLLYSSPSQTYTAGKHTQILDLGNYNSGLYFITATQGENTVLFTKKFVKN